MGFGFRASGSGFRVPGSAGRVPGLGSRENQKPETRNQKPNGRNPAAGFTLLEIVVAIAILGVVVTIVYESITAVTDATESARVSSEELRLRQFLVRNLSTNFGTVYCDPAFVNEQFQFIGAGQGGTGGGMDTVDFCSSAPLNGGVAPPGFYKHVHYGVVSHANSDFSLDSDSERGKDNLASSTVYLEASETLVLAAGSGEPGDSDILKTETPKEVTDMASPTWSAPISGMDISYYDGEKWVKEWDSLAILRMPWSVRIRINFAKTKAEEEAGSGNFGLEDAADLEMVIPIPIGDGVRTDAATWAQVIGAGQPGQLVPGVVTGGKTNTTAAGGTSNPRGSTLTQTIGNYNAGGKL
jgi:prepilin-type N-terminal cleavage/methylation domain-containing protein